MDWICLRFVMEFRIDVDENLRSVRRGEFLDQLSDSYFPKEHYVQWTQLYRTMRICGVDGGGYSRKFS